MGSTEYPGDHKCVIRSKLSLHKRGIAENCISKDEIVVKEKECEFMLSFCGNISFYVSAHTVLYKLKYFNKVKASFYHCVYTRPKKFTSQILQFCVQLCKWHRFREDRKWKLFLIHGGFRKFWKNGLNKVHISLY